MGGPRLLKTGRGPGVQEARHAQPWGGRQPAAQGVHRWWEGILQGLSFLVSKQIWFWRSHKQVNASESETELSPFALPAKMLWLITGIPALAPLTSGAV